MKTLRLNNGAAMPAFGLGTWKSEPGAVRAAVKTAVRSGYRHIDAAWIYGNEAEVGHALAELFADGEVERDAMWITSKLWNDAHAAEDVPQALEATLENLKLDYLDLYLMHWPVAQKRGVVFPQGADDLRSLNEVPLLETWRAMEALVDRCRCRSIGVANFSVKKLEALQRDAHIQPSVNQVEMHPYLQQTALLSHCKASGVAVTAYSPLGSPDRAATMRQEDEEVLLEDPVVAQIATRHAATPAQVLIAWALMRGTSVIPKSVTPVRIQENLAAAGMTLDDDAMEALARRERGQRYVHGQFWVHENGPYTLETLWD